MWFSSKTEENGVYRTYNTSNEKKVQAKPGRNKKKLYSLINQIN